MNTMREVSEQLSLRSYYLLSTAIYIVETLNKVSSFVFSYFISIFYRNKSLVINAWMHAHTLDFKISSKLIYISLQGIIFPKKTTQKMELYNNQSIHDLSEFSFEMISNVSLPEKIGMSLHLIVNLAKEILSTLTSTCLYSISLIGKLIYSNTSQFEKISFHEFYLLSGHFSYIFSSLEGVIVPVKAHYSMIKPSFENRYKC